MESVQWGTEAGEASSEDEADVREFRQVVKPVFFNMPLLRFVKILLGASLCTVVLNPPYALLSTNVVVGTADIKEAELLSDSPASSSIVIETMEEAERGLEAIAEKVSSVIAPDASAPLVRTAKKKTNQQATTVAPMGQTEAVVEADTKIAQNIMRPGGAAVNTDGEVAEDKLLQTVHMEAAEKTPEWTWRSANMLPHFIIAAVLLIGFGIQVRSRITGLLQGFSFAIAAVRKIRA